jgi:DNA mismatch repair protein MutS
MGKRYLREQILHPLQDMKEIKRRQKFISACKQDTILLGKIRDKLKYIIDLDMLLTRLSLQRVGPKDLIMLKTSLMAVRDIIHLIEASNNTTLKKIFQ